MTYRRRLLAAAFVVVVVIGSDLLASAQTFCQNSNGNYTSNSAYSAVSQRHPLLSANIGGDGFYNASAGEVNAAAMCRGDLQLEMCRDCVRTAGAQLLQSCPNQKQAVRSDDNCTLRYSNASLYGVLATVPVSYVWNLENVTSPAQFRADLRALLDNLRRKAAAGVGAPPRKVAAGNATGPDFQMIFGLVQCTPDLSEEECTSCLIDVISQIPECCDGSKGGRVVAPSCNVFFEIRPFYNETRLQELEFLPPPPLPLPPPPPPSPPPPLPVSPPPSSSSSGNGDDDGDATRTVIVIVVTIVFGLILAVSAFIWLRKRKMPKTTEDGHEDAGEISTPESLQYPFSTIKAATNDFSDDNKLGQGGFGAVYQGKLPNGMEIAVKRLSMNSGQGDLEFKNEVLLLAKLQHRNLVRLLGFAIEGREKLLIYELVRNASLDHFIFGERSHLYLDWDRRYKIIGGIARGILYLHEDSRLRIIHRDLKAGNILLDGEMNPKIADFGMARLFGQDETQGNTRRIVGTYGYMPPEYVIHGHFSIKSDVFSFGVLVLEIISGRRNNSFLSGDNGDLLSFAWKNWREGRAVNVVDPSLRSGVGLMSEMVRCIHIGLLCVQKDSAERPTMASVVIMLSSSSISLAVPSEPAFYVPGSSASRNDGFNSGDLRAAGQSYRLSKNGVSITELHPR